MKTIMVVDDEPRLCESIERLLYGSGLRLRVCPCTTTDLAVECIENADIDMAILDIIMPCHYGIDLVPLIRDLHPGCKVYIMTGSPEYEGAAMSLGVDRFLLKPFDVHELKQFIKEDLEI